MDVSSWFAASFAVEGRVSMGRSSVVSVRDGRRLPNVRSAGDRRGRRRGVPLVPSMPRTLFLPLPWLVETKT
jgi:hypothetical protein